MQKVIVLDFGGQYKELIARRVRECGVYSVILPGSTPVSELKAQNPIGIIMTGGPASVNEPDSPTCSSELFSAGIPVLGICYGMQLMCKLLGGKVSRGVTGEYGKTGASFCGDNTMFDGLAQKANVLMSHFDFVSVLPEGFERSAFTDACPNAAAFCRQKKLYAVQFHPEVVHTENGKKMIRAFLYNVCAAKGDHTMSGYVDSQIRSIRERVGDKKVLLALSGGVDSSVCAALLSRAIPGQLTCIFVDHGFMRKGEPEQIESIFSKRDLTFIRADAADRFMAKLAGVTEPEKKRKLIGAEFIEVFRDEAKKIGGADFLAQGTIYPDIVESGTKNSATIKSHHNVGGLPAEIGFEGIIEPLAGLFKDEVRKVGRQLGLPPELVNRQPFPGPGLAIRIIGEVTPARLAILRDADAILREEISASHYRADQYFAVLTDLRSVGVMGDERTYDYTLALRAVVTGDFMTAEYAKLPHRILSHISKRITNEVKGINRIVYDITDKPPGTIEWE